MTNITSSEHLPEVNHIHQRKVEKIHISAERVKNENAAGTTYCIMYFTPSVSETFLLQLLRQQKCEVAHILA